MTITTRTNYNAIRAAVTRVDEARTELNRLSSLNIGVISGGIDLTDETAEFDSAYATLGTLVSSAMQNGARLSYLLEQVRGERLIAQMVSEEIWTRQQMADYR